jgi:hypothetical protein
MLRISSPADQTNCDFMENAVSITGILNVDTGRFHTHATPPCPLPSSPSPPSSPLTSTRPHHPHPPQQVSIKSYKPAPFPGLGPRCSYYEPFSRSTLWITADKNATLPVKGGTYYLAAFLDGRKSTGRLTVAIADWAESEDFKRPYAAPAGNRNVSWADGTAAARCCGADGAAAANKAGDLKSCPPFSAFG